jgi:hypothetical protein
MRPTDKEQIQFLFQCYFGGTGRTKLEKFISRGYRDMNRTFATGEIANKDTLLDNAKKKLVECLDALRNPPEENNLQSKFDMWHSATCWEIKDYYARTLSNTDSKAKFSYGQAQKWINMTLKYCWVCGGNDFCWLEPWFPVAHVAVDNVILETAKAKGVVATRPCEKWSRWDSEKEYQDFQQRLREFAAQKKISPLRLEFEWWQEANHD